MRRKAAERLGRAQAAYTAARLGDRAVDREVIAATRAELERAELFALVVGWLTACA